MHWTILAFKASVDAVMFGEDKVVVESISQPDQELQSYSCGAYHIKKS